MEASLQGVTVVETGSRVAASVCGLILRELGADVVVPASPSPTLPGTSAADREAFAAGKRSVALDEAQAGERESWRALVARADVVLFSSDADGEIIATSPASDRQICCDITAFGADATRAGRAFGDLEIQALSGIMETTGLPDGPPTPIATPIVEIMTGLYAACAVILALRARRSTGKGQAIDMALFDCAFAAMSTFLSSALTGGPTIGRLGNMHPAAAPWNAYRAKDGWVLICAGSDAQWERLCAVIGRPDMAASALYRSQTDRVARYAEIDRTIEAWSRERAVDDCVSVLTAAMIAASRVVTIDDYPREPNLEHRKSVRQIADARGGTTRFVSRTPLRVTRSAVAARARAHGLGDGGSAAAVAPDEVPRPLAGVRVVEIGHYTTAPLTARHCASMGAEVIKVEPPGGESTRTWPPLQAGESIFFRSNNAEKLGICLDLKTSEGIAALTSLIRDADVLVENLKPGALAKLGFSWEVLRKLNPRLVYCSITGFGADSIYANRPAFDTVIQAASGFMDAMGVDGMPVKSGISSADLLGAQFALVGVLAALEARDKDGSGAWIDLSMQDVAAWATQTSWNGRRAAADATVVRCRDGHVLVTPSLGGADIEALVGDAAHRSRQELVQALETNNVAATPILSVREATELPQCAQRKLWSYREEAGIAWPLLASPLRLERTPPRLERLAPHLDEHRAAILAGIERVATGDARRSA